MKKFPGDKVKQLNLLLYCRVMETENAKLVFTKYEEMLQLLSV